jgi:hypothetical protein
MRVMLWTAVILLWSAVAWAATPFDGRWAAEAGNEKLTFTLTVGEEGRVSGSIALAGAGDTPIEWGFVKGDLITFRVQRVFQGSPRPFIYIGKVDGDQIAFGRRPEDLSLGQLREMTATRVK